MFSRRSYFEHTPHIALFVQGTRHIFSMYRGSQCADLDQGTHETLHLYRFADCIILVAKTAQVLSRNLHALVEINRLASEALVLIQLLGECLFALPITAICLRIYSTATYIAFPSLTACSIIEPRCIVLRSPPARNPLTFL